MPTAMNRDVRIEYETEGDPGGEPVLLIAGVADQLIYWPDRFCRRLAGHGCFVVRFDNRDTGLSSRVQQQYGIDDMVADAVAVLDASGIGAATIVGNSQGGMVA